jgi:hypothetical protein
MIIVSSQTPFPLIHAVLEVGGATVVDNTYRGVMEELLHLAHFSGSNDSTQHDGASTGSAVARLKAFAGMSSNSMSTLCIFLGLQTQHDGESTGSAVARLKAFAGMSSNSMSTWKHRLESEACEWRAYGLSCRWK